MGGIATAHSKATPDEVNAIIKNLSPKKIIGISICNVFKHNKWLDKIDFDVLVDGTLDPVNLWKK